MKKIILIIVAVAIVLAVMAAWPKTAPRLEGTIEADWVYVGAGVGGKLETLDVARGTQVAAGGQLFSVEALPYRTAADAARADWKQAQASEELAQKNRDRQEALFEKNVVSQESLDARRTELDEAVSAVEAAKANLAKADWSLRETVQESPAAGLVYDTLFSVGEQVAAGAPVVVLLPPKAVYAKVFVGQEKLGILKVGDAAKVWVDGRDEAVEGRVRYIAPKAEYTPPVIYSKENREKFVWKVELEFTPEVAARLHPGQPVDVELPPSPRLKAD